MRQQRAELSDNTVQTAPIWYQSDSSKVSQLFVLVARFPPVLPLKYLDIKIRIRSWQALTSQRQKLGAINNSGFKVWSCCLLWQMLCYVNTTKNAISISQILPARLEGWARARKAARELQRNAAAMIFYHLTSAPLTLPSMGHLNFILRSSH